MFMSLHNIYKSQQSNLQVQSANSQIIWTSITPRSQRRILFAQMCKKDKTQVKQTYEVFSYIQ
jgi:hypothetical protein